MVRTARTIQKPSRPTRPSYHHPPTGGNPYPATTHIRFLEEWRKGRKVAEIAAVVGISRALAFNWQRNLLDYGSIKRPCQVPLGRPHKLSIADEEALFKVLQTHGWMYLDEMQMYLVEERNVNITVSSISRLLKKNGWTKKKLYLASINRNEELREQYKHRMAAYHQDDLIFIDESIFNEKTGWRTKAWGPIGEPARYQSSISRGNTWSILPAMSRYGYLNCTGIKKGYFSREDLMLWIRQQLLPALRERFGARGVVVVMDNCSIHVKREVVDLIQSEGHLVEYLPPYSPDFNPIELTFALIKAWIKRHYWMMRHRCENFGDFLRLAVRESGCDNFAAKQFRHAADGQYLTREAYERLQEEVRTWEIGRIGLEGIEVVDGT
jgi:transposase